ncbi:hypothetical protein SS1G_09132 [Sclerotinia sclerotiorum 1980 UF-70]|uniref:mRNA export factor GLE1 n=2 Tax=Sclerotinia sclerotiorum (strain ATCC 18683 / 1980 / Ss-1) TaxID=665079 RepID=A7EUX4_SCLS1|nr:hypothetical protein SS1G_09132 [Sclerotinia sclerotiorum 1980 UF-70]APA15449.1 hypothetical protein sscle_14g102190 [Sclerotinia sclerotiorum 1980 UF-70]EDN93266.1 hypothetical protein SS1G_09132 [Sclerotinia sclerotiorum 1980 UF-70]
MAANQSSNGEDETLGANYNFIPVPSVYEHDIRFDNRNAEELHHGILEAARVEHERVRNEAVRIFQITLLQEQQLRAQQEVQAEQKRLQIEEMRLKIEENRVQTERQNALAEIKRRELEEEAKRIPVVPPKPPTPPPVAPPKVPVQMNSNPPQNQFQNPQQQQQQQGNTSWGLFGAPSQRTDGSGQSKPQQASPLSRPQLQQQTNGFSDVQQEPPKQSSAPPPPQQPTSTRQASASSKDHLLPGLERYVEIHKNLKQLRQYLVAEGKQNLPFKKMLGDYRRSIRQTVGQLTGERGANKECINKIVDLLTQSLRRVQSPGIDPSNYMISKPNPVQGAQNNGDQLPSLFIYLLNFFSKAIVSQFTTEAGVRPETADPVGVIAVSIFAKTEFLWRGASLIDILIAKMRISIPIIFGVRGNEKTEEGRARVGWQRLEDGSWIDEQIHNNRMVGLAAGYAAISLRDFSKAKVTNPWPPTNYWRSMASIVSTPTEQASPSQYTVLRSMIEGWEQRFIELYGVQAVAALRVALIDFPARAPPAAKVAADSLSVLVDKLERDKGLRLAY